MNVHQIAENVGKLSETLVKGSFLFDFLLAYGLPKASVTRLEKGDYDLSKKQGEVLWKKKIFFKEEVKSDLHSLIDRLKKDPVIKRQAPRFIVVTDYETLLALDTSNGDTLDIQIRNLGKYFDFFLPLVGMEKSQIRAENPADRKAAEKMGQLYDLILQDNNIKNDKDRHALNVFFSRILFCFFAEDTGIFSEGQFTSAIETYTQSDGSDLQRFLETIFKILNLRERSGVPHFLQEFPYVNGGLFSEALPVPKLGPKSREIIIDCGSLNWKAINPDIFGSMFQAVSHVDQRSSLGMHYTSVANIMKVIEPLFLNDLYEELGQAKENEKKLKKLLDRIYRISIFDPACGAGNFLIIAYKELCKLEIEIFKKLYGTQLSFRSDSQIKLSQFYGIEIDDFAHETAKLSLWLAEHQMNMAFKDIFGESRPTLPLRAGGNIVCANATREDWEKVCSCIEADELYIIGNPPYVGARNQSELQKADLKQVFSGDETYKDADYVTSWFLKAAGFLSTLWHKNDMLAKIGFVATNSICQGEQVGILWPRLFSHGLEIGFAHQSFKWTNNAKGNAGVTCVIVGLRKVSTQKKILFDGSTAKFASNISPYLLDTDTVIVEGSKRPLNGLPRAVMGNMPRDGGNLILSTEEKNSLVEKYPQASEIIKKYIGATEFIDGKERWCLWISDEQRQLAESIPDIASRIQKVFKFRKGSRAKTTNGYATIPHKFAQRSPNRGNSIIIPGHTSERRQYVPFGFFDESIIISNAALAIFEAEPWLFGLISSRMHMVWVRTVGGRIKTDYRYSTELCYNTFPVPELSSAQKKELEEHVFSILDERERHSQKTIAELYDPEAMPSGLLEAHHRLDIAVERCYRSRLFNSDLERIEYLFKLYIEMVENQRTQELTHA